MKPTMISFLSLLFLELLAVATITVSFSNGSTYVGCIQYEREALLRIKQDLNDSSNRLSSWVGDHGDCCRWDAVVCSNFTGHVLELHLGNPFSDQYFSFYAEYEAYERSMLRGKISSSLLDLKHLVYLDLSYNDFEGVQFPRFLGSMNNLRYLNLSRSYFGGMIPLQLGNLSTLQFLDLSYNYDFSRDNYDRLLFTESLSWLSGLSSLKHLDLSWVNLSVASSDWLLEINKLSSLTVLRLSYCRLQHIPPLPFANFTSSLTTLDLSGNQFDNPSPRLLEIYKLSSLKVLLLLNCGLQHIPPLPFSNFTSSLTTLDLSWNQFDNTSTDWLLEIYKLSSLKVLQLSDCGLHHIPLSPFPNFTSSLTTLDLSYNQFDNTSADWLLEIYKLSSLKVLQLSDCGLHHIPLSPFPNFSLSLTTLDLSSNQFDNTSMPSWVFSLRNLEFLDVRENNFKGPIPDGLMNLTSLQHLDLSSNYFNSSIPNWLSRIRSLESLDLSYNSNLQGPIPISLGRLCNLKSLSLSSIKLNQDIYDIFHIFSECIIDGLEVLEMSSCQLFGQLTNDQLGLSKNLEVLRIGSNSISGYVPSSLGELSFLHELDLSYNKLNGTLAKIHFANLTRLTNFDASGNSLKVNHDWVPPFQLQYLHLSSCHLGPQFPSWLRSLQGLFDLDLSSSGIVDSIPSWFWRSISHLGYLNLSHNQIQGEIPNLNSFPYLDYLNLCSNNFSGPLPLIPPTLSNVYLSDNAFSGSIFHFLCHKINEPRRIGILKLGNNFLSRELPDCWMNWQDLVVLDLSDNTFTGNIPFSIGNLNDLASLHLRNNSLSGEIPTSLRNCTALETLDIGENKFFGSVPTWLGQRFSKLVILNLRSNKFHGFLPKEFCHLTSLQILDLAYNDLSGSIPSCIHNFSTMVTMNYSKGNSIRLPYNIYEIPMEDATILMKGTTAQYDSILNLVRSVDLSKNNFSGEIPTELTSLHALQSLNLSHNSLTGRIPETIGDMRDLESIDLSANRLYGEIPQSITGLTFLNHLNLSNNKLTGRIPSSTQLQSFNASSFTGNELCGSPMKNCTVATVPTPRHENGEHEVDWFYVSMALGFVVGFWSLIGPLLFNRRWRYTYCRFLDRLGDKFYFGVRKLF